MKKFLLLFVAFTLTLALAGCAECEECEQCEECEVCETCETCDECLLDDVAIPAVVNMDNVDDFMGRPDVQYVDLRNFDDKMKAGYIAGFEFIPYFDYLEYEEILVRTDGNFTFAAEDILNEAALRALFDEDKTIFLMCQSGGRAGFVKAALESLGYTNVYNIGGWGAGEIPYYDGSTARENIVEGDGTYLLEPYAKGDYVPGTYHATNDAGYLATVIINVQGGIQSVTIDAITCYDESDPADGIKESCYSKQNLGFGYNMKAFGTSAVDGTSPVTYEWFEQANLVAAAVLANQGWNDDWDQQDLNGHMRFVWDDAEVVADGVSGVTVGVEGFEEVVKAALTAATPAS
jgi:rhodanese-related sulfurtransferase